MCNAASFRSRGAVALTHETLLNGRNGAKILQTDQVGIVLSSDKAIYYLFIFKKIV